LARSYVTNNRLDKCIELERIGRRQSFTHSISSIIGVRFASVVMIVLDVSLNFQIKRNGPKNMNRQLFSGTMKCGKNDERVRPVDKMWSFNENLSQPHQTM
jgi:hypothetical protein